MDKFSALIASKTMIMMFGNVLFESSPAKIEGASLDNVAAAGKEKTSFKKSRRSIFSNAPI
jgi:hypothetical protein